MGALLPVIRVGDRTSHGGTVIEGFADGHYEVYGIPAAGLGHAVTCPVHPGIHRIAEGESSCDVRGVPIALEGMKTTCDATLIASQQNMVVEHRGKATIADSGRFYQDSETGEWQPGGDPGPHDEQFILQDRSSGKPLANVPYVIETGSGKVFSGTTDSQGRTDRVSTGNRTEALTLRIRHEGNHD